MSNFTPTPAQARKYADYSVTIRDVPRRVEIVSEDKGVARYFVQVQRIPSHKTFEVRLLAGATEAERGWVEKYLAPQLPAGRWAETPDEWTPHRFSSGRMFFSMLRGIYVDVDWTAIELEMMLDVPAEVR